MEYMLFSTYFRISDLAGRYIIRNVLYIHSQSHFSETDTDRIQSNCRLMNEMYLTHSCFFSVCGGRCKGQAGGGAWPRSGLKKITKSEMKLSYLTSKLTHIKLITSGKILRHSCVYQCVLKCVRVSHISNIISNSKSQFD